MRMSISCLQNTFIFLPCNWKALTGSLFIHLRINCTSYWIECVQKKYATSFWKRLKILQDNVTSFKEIETVPVWAQVLLRTKNLFPMSGYARTSCALIRKLCCISLLLWQNFGLSDSLSNTSINSVWAVFLGLWTKLYTCLSNKIRFDRGSCFGRDSYTIPGGVMIDSVRSGIETHFRFCMEECIY